MMMSLQKTRRTDRPDQLKSAEESSRNPETPDRVREAERRAGEEGKRKKDEILQNLEPKLATR